MSGTNPFRPKDKPTYIAPAIYGESASDKTSQLPPIDTGVLQTSKSKTGKTVRIISPQSASSDLEDSSDDDDSLLTKSVSPPLSDRSENETADNPFRAENHQQGRKSDDGMRSSQSSASTQNRLEVTDVAPTNANESRERKVADIDATQRPQYDVDAFKKLLLTGEKSQESGHGAAPTVSFGGVVAPLDDNFSPTDVSAVPDHLASTASSTQRDISGRLQKETRSYAELSSTENQIRRSTAKVKPSTPQHRHGKLVRPVASLAPNAFVSDNTVGSIGTREGSQLPHHHAEDQASRLETTTTTPQKRLAPTPPPARRHGQSRPTSFITDPHRSNQHPQLESSTTPSSSQSPPPTQTRPLPPARRRTGSIRRDSSSSITTGTSFANQAGTPLSRSPSITSNKNPYVSSSLASSPPMAPPPPPPRRRGSSQSSYTPSRLSGDYRSIMNQRPRGDSGASSISQFQMPSSEAATTNPKAERKDVMADLSALQRDVDELRERVGQ